MENNEAVNYINSEFARGVSKEKIISSLLQAGWQSSAIEEAFESVTPLTNISQASGIIATEKEYPITRLWIFKTFIIIIFVSIIAIFFGYWFPYLIAMIPVSLIINALIRANFHYSTDDKFFVVRQGVISKKQHNLPYGVIQNIFVKQDLFDRIFGLATLRIENASDGGGKGILGGKKEYDWGDVFAIVSKTNQNQDAGVGSYGNRINIPGMSKISAETLKGIVLQKMKENPSSDSQSGL